MIGTPGTARRSRPGLLLVLVFLVALAATAATAHAQAPADQRALAEKWAPIVKVPEAGGCEAGVPYEPIDVDLLFGNDEVALRGPWDRVNLVGVAPTAETLGRGLFDYHLDFPGGTLDPGCTYEEWSARLAEKGRATTYARVVAEPGKPGLIALQYWFYYVFNDWNNNHEGDWEMIQLVFPADTAAQALGTDPIDLGYSQHSSAERAEWGDPKIETVDRTHPVVYPAGGSHANFYGSELYLMRSQAEGMGCDDTRDVAETVRPRVVTIPTDEADYRREFPWLGFQGRWGEKQAAFFNGPTGPNMKSQWTRPITWSETSWRERSFTVPSGGPAAPAATEVFCEAVAAGSEVLRRAKADPLTTVLVLGGLLVLLVWALTRTTWRPAVTLPVRRRRAWGQLVLTAWRTYRARPRLFLGIGLLFLPLGIAITALQYLVFRVSTLAPMVDEAGPTNPFVSLLAMTLGITLSLVAFSIVQAAVGRAMVEIEAGREVTAPDAYRLIVPRLPTLLRALAVAVVVILVCLSTLVLIPVAVFLIARWSILGVVAGTEDGSTRLLRRSFDLTHGALWRAASITVIVTGAALLLGPLIGTLILIVSSASFDFINLISAAVYVAALPFPAIVMTYLTGDLRERRAAEAAAATPAAAPGTA